MRRNFVSLIHSIFEVLVMRQVVRHCHREESGPFCWPVPAACIAVFHDFRGNDFTRIQKAVVDQTDSRPPNSDYHLFLVQVWLWEVLWSFFSVQQWAGCQQLSYIIHFSSHITIQSRNGSSLCRIREDDTSKGCFFWFAVNSWGIHLASFFIFPTGFKCQTTIERSRLSSSATSCVVIRGSALMILSVGCCHLQMTGHSLACHLQGSCLLCKHPLNHRCALRL